VRGISGKVLVIAWSFGAFVLGPSAAHAQVGKTAAQLEEEVKTRVLPRVENPATKAERGGKVFDILQQNEQLQEMVRTSNSREEIDQKLEAADKSLFYDQRWGTDAALVAKTYASDAETVSTDFRQCQPMGHTFEQVMDEPQRIFGGCLYKVVFPGIASGLCRKCIPVSSFICADGCIWIEGDFVEYHFPTYKLDASEQPYQSLYINEADVRGPEGYAAKNQRDMEERGKGVALDNLKKVNAAAKMTLAEKGIDLQEMPDLTSIATGIDATLADVPEQLKTTVPGDSRVYTRIITEPENLRTQNMWWIPHVIPTDSTLFGSDLPPYFTLASRSLGLGSLSILADPILAQKLFKFLAPRGMFSCVDQNKRQGKTAIDLDVPSSGANNKDLCLKNVGERFPLTDTRRVSITDRTWRGIAKHLDLFLAVIPEGERHSYIEEKDRMLVLRNEKLKRESPGCKPLEEMTRINIDYDTANLKDLKTGGENTVELFTGFRGCWGFKGVQRGWWDYVITRNGDDSFRLQ
jgi:hypothetical protein